MTEFNVRPNIAPTVKEAIEADNESLVKLGTEKVAAAVVETEPKKEEYGFTKAQAEALLKLANSLRTLSIKTGIVKE